MAARWRTVLGVCITALILLSGCTMNEGDQFVVATAGNEGDITLSVRASAEIRYHYYVTCSGDPECMRLGIENTEWVTDNKWGPKAIRRLSELFASEPNDGPGSILSTLGYNEGLNSAGICLVLDRFGGGAHGRADLASADGGINRCFMGHSMDVG